MRLTQLTETFVITNDQFEDYLNRSTEQLKSELDMGKSHRDAIHDLARAFADMHNKSYDAYERMSDSLLARFHILELDNDSATIDQEPTDIEPEMDMGEPAMDIEPEMDMGEPEPEMDLEDEVEESLLRLNAGNEFSGELAKAKIDGKKEFKVDGKKYKVEEDEEGARGYIVFHSKKGKFETHADTSYEAATKAAKHWKLKSTAGVSAHLVQDDKGDEVTQVAESGTALKKGDNVVHAEKGSSGKVIKIESDGKVVVKWSFSKSTSTVNPNTIVKSGSQDKRKSKTNEVVESGPTKAIDTIKQIVADTQNMQVKFDDGKMRVDLYTASAVSQVYDAVKPETQAKMDNMLKTKAGMLKMSNFAFSSLKEGYAPGMHPNSIATRAKPGLGNKPAVAPLNTKQGTLNKAGKLAGVAAVGSVVKKIGKAVGGAMAGAATRSGFGNPLSASKYSESKAESIMSNAMNKSVKEEEIKKKTNIAIYTDKTSNGSGHLKSLNQAQDIGMKAALAKHTGADYELMDFINDINDTSVKYSENLLIAMNGKRFSLYSANGQLRLGAGGSLSSPEEVLEYILISDLIAGISSAKLF